MKRMVVLLVILVILVSGLFPLPVRAASNTFFSFEEKNVILANSDIELIANDGNKFFAIVRQNGVANLYSSSDRGKSWVKIITQGLPEYERYLVLKIVGVIGQPASAIALATKSAVYLSRDGIRFSYLNGPSGLVERGEEITSMALISGSLIAVGVWNPDSGKFPFDGVYVYDANLWQPQGMRQTLQGKGYLADVMAVEFGEGAMIVVATGDPDSSGPLSEGTYLNIGFPTSGGFDNPGNWNSYNSGQPIEISQPAGQSPKAGEIVRALIASGFSSGQKIYVAYNTNTRAKAKDDVFSITFANQFSGAQVKKLLFPVSVSALVSFDNMVFAKNMLMVGVTKTTTSRTANQVYYLTRSDEQSSQPYWNYYLPLADDSNNAQIMALPDGSVFLGNSGQSSCFARLDDNTRFTSISLIDASGGISQVVVSSANSVLVAYGDKNIFKLSWADNQLGGLERVSYVSAGFNPIGIRMLVASDGSLLLFEVGKKTYLIINGSVRQREVPITVSDAIADTIGKVWIAGSGGLIYTITDSNSVFQLGRPSGLAWVGKLEIGPTGKILAIGGSRDGLMESVSIISGSSFQSLPPLPTPTYYGWQIVSQEEAAYAMAGNQLWRAKIGADYWEKLGDLNFSGTQLRVSVQGIYALAQPDIWFSASPDKSQWVKADLGGINRSWTGVRVIGLDQKKNLLVLWDSGAIYLYVHVIPEATGIVPPTVPTVAPKPPPPPTPAPKPTPTLTPTPTPTPAPKPAPAPPTVKPTPSPTVQPPRPTPTQPAVKPPAGTAGPSFWSNVWDGFWRVVKVVAVVLFVVIVTIVIILLFRRPRP